MAEYKEWTTTQRNILDEKSRCVVGKGHCSLIEVTVLNTIWTGSENAQTNYQAILSDYLPLASRCPMAHPTFLYRPWWACRMCLLTYRNRQYPVSGLVSLLSRDCHAHHHTHAYPIAVAYSNYPAVQES